MIDLSTYGRPLWHKIVGESRRQDLLRRIDDGASRRGERKDFTALVIPEPTNPHDVNAIRIDAQGHGQIGYFSREDAQEYRGLSLTLQAAGTMGFCPGQIVGGWDVEAGKEKYFGAVIQIPVAEAFDKGIKQEGYERQARVGDWRSRRRIPLVSCTAKVLLIEEVSCQEELERIDMGRTARGEITTFQAAIIPGEFDPVEPRRLYVAAVDGRLVGRLGKPQAVKYGALATDLTDFDAVAICEATVVIEREALGAFVMLPPPEQAAATIG